MGGAAVPYRSWVLLIMAMVAAAMALGQVEAGLNEHKKSVRILNQLPDTLTLHCKSREDDLHTQYLPPGKDYYFSFYLNTWGTTDYWCQFRDGKRWNGFDVWTGPGVWGTDAVPCQHCLWIVKIEGFYRAEEGKTPIIQKPWRQDYI